MAGPQPYADQWITLIFEDLLAPHATQCTNDLRKTPATDDLLIEIIDPQELHLQGHHEVECLIVHPPPSAEGDQTSFGAHTLRLPPDRLCKVG